jgi:serine protease Do
MKQRIFWGGLLMAGILISGSSFGQNGTPGEKNSEEIIIRKNGDSAKKMTVEINGNDVTINGKPISDYKGGDIEIIRRESKNGNFSNSFNTPGQQQMEYEIFDNGNNNSTESHTFLGVMTAKADNGVKISEVMDGTAAEKAGLKAGDIITKLGDKDIKAPSDLLEAVEAHKPGDEVSITYLRNDKKIDTQVKLGERKVNSKQMIIGGENPGMNGNSFGFNMPNMPNMQWAPSGRMPNFQGLPGQNFRFWFNNENRPKLGLKIQDTENGDGVKILGVEEGSAAAKAGLKKDDIITSFNGDKVSSVDDVINQLDQSQDKGTVDIKAMRNKSEMDFEVKIPKNLKSANL